MQSFLRLLSANGPIGLTILRVVMGIIFLVAGYGKVMHGGFAINGFRNLGIALPEVAGPVVSIVELGGGVLLILGLFTRLLGVVYAIEFIVATLVIMNLKGLLGARLEVMILVGAIVLATNGSGALSLGRARNLDV